jgi:hypothetical protein
MEPSSELRELIRRFYGVFESGDLATAREVMSHDDRLLIAGTDPGEFARGLEQVLHMVQQQSEMIRANGLAIVPGESEAYTEGTVGWIWDRPRFRMPDGTEIQARLAAVAHREDGAWRIVQIHASVEPAES